MKKPIVRVKDVCDAIEEFAPSGLAYSWDNGGLLIGNPQREVSGVILTLTVTEEVLKKTRTWGGNMIITHHPLIWKPLHVIRTDEMVGKFCAELLKNDIACFATHTALDLAENGVNQALAESLGLRDLQVLFSEMQGREVKLVTFVPESHLEVVRKAVCDAGAGIIGEYRYCSFSTLGMGTFLPSEKSKPFSGKKLCLNEEPERRFEVLVLEAILPRVLRALRAVHPYEEPAYDIIPLTTCDRRIGMGRVGSLSEPMVFEKFIDYVARRLEAKGIRVVTKSSKKLVKTVGVLAGSGGKYISRCPASLDVFITGELTYHEAEEALARGISVVEVGHATSERVVLRPLAKYLATKLPLRIQILKSQEPFNFWVM